MLIRHHFTHRVILPRLRSWEIGTSSADTIRWDENAGLQAITLIEVVPLATGKFPFRVTG
jgi:hypothetical protein